MRAEVPAMKEVSMTSTRLRRPQLRRLALHLVCFAPLAVGSISLASAQTVEAVPAPESKPGQVEAIPTTFAIDDEDPESTIPTPEQAMRNPLQMGYLMMAFSDRAEAALQRGQPERAAKYYRAMAKAVPDRAVSFRKACSAHELAGQLDKALEMCRAALGKGGVTVADHLAFAQIQLKQPGALSPREVEDLDAVIDRLHKEPGVGAKDATWPMRLVELKCQVATRLAQRERLSACVADLDKLKVERGKTLPYRWALAMSTQDIATAKRTMEEAELAKLPASAVEVMKTGLLKAESAKTEAVVRTARSWWPAAVVLALALVGMLAVKLRRRNPLRPA